MAKNKRLRPVKDYRKCIRCRVGGLVRAEPAMDGRPAFRCTRCGDYFTWGKDGGEYAKAVPEVKAGA